MQLTGLLSIYNKPWLIEPNAAVQMLELFNSIKAGEDDFKPEQVKVVSVLTGMSGVMVAPQSTWEMRDFQGFAGAETVVIPMSGPLMKSDYCGALGTASIRSLFAAAEAESSVKNIILAVDSPGGTVDGTEGFAGQIAASTKRTICAVDGMCASAAMWIGSSCDEMYATSQTDFVGSIGTMVSMTDNSEAMKSRGVVLREYYATASTDKNKVFQEARDGNGKALISEVLDPINDVFMATVTANRGGKLDPSTLTGKMYPAQAAVELGLLDGIMPMEQIISKCKISNNYTYMTAEQIKAAHPEAYNAIVATGISQERERVNTFLAFHSADAETVIGKIKSGESVTSAFQAEMVVKLTNKNTLAAVVADSPAPVGAVSPAVTATETPANGELTPAQLEAQVKKLMQDYN